ncbi:DUF2510 domain-containing protein [Fodinibacter luteus]
MPPSTATPPGWYPDTQSSVPLLRYWDGTRWTTQTSLRPADGGGSPPSAATTASARPPRSRWWQAVKWGAVAAFLLATAVVGVALLVNHQQVCSVSTKGEFTFAAAGEQCVPKQELDEKQQALTQDVAPSKAAASAAPVPPSLPDLNGSWLGAGGSTYTITQGGSQATIEEYTPGLGLTAAGVGTVSDAGARFQLTGYDGSTGFADFQLQGPDTLSGVMANVTYQLQAPAVLTRTG